MPRLTHCVPLLAVVLLAVPAVSAQSTSAPAAEKSRKEKAKPKEKAPPKVYTNDDLEATSTRPSNVQNATAQGGQPYAPPPAPENPPEQPSEPPPAGPQMSEQEARIKELEETIKGLEADAKAILWQYLQSSDSNEILQLKAQQQGILEQIEQTKAELARVKGEAGSGPPPTTAPTPPPG